MRSIALVDYGLSNIFSVSNAFEALGEDVSVISDGRSDLSDSKVLIIPGVASFGAGARALKAKGLEEIILDWVSRGRPVIGLCLGAQLLFERSEESPEAKGLGILSGEVRAIRHRSSLDTAQGWFRLSPNEFSPARAGDYFYFSHSYECLPSSKDASVIETEEAGGHRVTAVVLENNMCAVQFHPERSGATGLAFLEAVLANVGKG